MRAVVLAGGRGTRLAPYTSVLPKPLLPIGDRAILEVVVQQLWGAGFTDITLCVGYLSHLIEAVFANSNVADLGVTLRYVREDEPRGTAGPLRFVEGLDETFLVMNGDILTDLDFATMLRAHRDSGDILTIAAHARSMTIDYGVLHLNGVDTPVGRVQAYDEKPQLPLLVSMGIYMLEPRALMRIPEGCSFDFPDLVQALLAAQEPVGAYVFDGFWLDIGRHEDYSEALRAIEENEHLRS